jgi:hypothetical protein
MFRTGSAGCFRGCGAGGLGKRDQHAIALADGRRLEQADLLAIIYGGHRYRRHLGSFRTGTGLESRRHVHVLPLYGWYLPLANTNRSVPFIR